MPPLLPPGDQLPCSGRLGCSRPRRGRAPEGRYFYNPLRQLRELVLLPHSSRAPEDATARNAPAQTLGYRRPRLRRGSLLPSMADLSEQQNKLGSGHDLHSGEGKQLLAEVFERVPDMIDLIVDYQKPVVSLVVIV